MRFFSKIVFICNLCFLASVILRWVEIINKKHEGYTGDAIQLQPLKSTIVILGYGAIFINIIFNGIILALLLAKKELPVPKWLIWLNFLFLIAQVYYFFFF
ncbi:MAG: hypothetical protein QM791_11045 [Ferruginibacter sp.]